MPVASVEGDLNFSVFKRVKLLLGMFGVWALLLAGCSSEATHEWLEAPGWSRARVVGRTEGGYPMFPAIGADGRRYFAVSYFEGGNPSLEVFVLDETLEPVWRKNFSLEGNQATKKVSLILTSLGPEMFWLKGEALNSVLLSADGEILREPTRLSDEHGVAYYDAVVDKDGVRVVWFSDGRSNPGVYAVDSAGVVRLVDGQGYKPQLQMDAAGGLHAVWVRDAVGDTQINFYYAYYPDAIFTLNQQRLVHSTILSVTSGLEGPKLGLDAERAYIFWSEVVRTGLEAGEIKAYYVDFPARNAEDTGTSTETPLLFPNEFNLNYSKNGVKAADEVDAGPRALASEQTLPLFTRLTDIYANPQQSGELVVAFRARLPFLRHREAYQTGLIFLNEGQASGYQLLSFTPAISELPSIQADSDGYLHATWLEQVGMDDYKLYYATTEPVGKKALDALTNDDRMRMGGEALFGLVSNVLLIPFPIFWALGAITVSFLISPLRRENEPFTAPATLLTMIAGLGAYFAIKFFTLPGIQDYVPFSAWIPILPESWFNLLRVGVPVVLGLLGFVVAYRRTYGRRNYSPLFFFLIYALVDGVLTIAIYGVLFYGDV